MIEREQVGESFLWADDYIELPNDDNWLVEPIIPAQGIVNFYGKPKSGKSFAAIGIAQAVASGAREWNGFPVQKHGKVLYFQIDTPRPEWIRRFKRIKDHGYNISNIAIIDTKLAPYPFDLMNQRHRNWLELQYESVQPVLVVIDTLREIHSLNENDSTDMKKVINNIVKLALPYDAAILLVSHSRKDSAFNAVGADSDLMDEGRGSSYTSGRMDTVVKFTGRGKPMKGHMHYKGRSTEENKKPIFQDPETLLIVVNEAHAKREQLILTVLREHGEEWSVRKMATWVHEQTGVSIRQLERDIAAVKGEAK